MTLFEELGRRGLIAQTTHPQEIEERMNKGGLVFYIGFDATADSLHVGHFLQLTIIKRMQQAGHMPILLLGTGTTMVGDPTGRTDMRKMLSIEEINHNADRFLEQMGRIVDISPGKAIVDRNGDWLMSLNYVELLRDIGVHFSVNKMLSYDCFKSRMEKGLSFIEFNYMIMQSYDFLHLYRKYHCQMQFGGNDQWSNIISGVDLIRRVEDGAEAYGMTFTLLATKDGHKMGKTANGAVWLDREKTNPYDFFQYWRNVDDADVLNCLKMLTFVPIEEIEAMERWEGSQLNKAKEILAYELTKDVHSREDADQALRTAQSLFAGGVSEEMPGTVLSRSDLTDNAVNILDLLVLTRLCPSKGEARRLIQQNGVSLDAGTGEFAAVTDIALNVGQDVLTGGIVLRKGKKVFHRVTVE